MCHRPGSPWPHHRLAGHPGGSLNVSVLWFPSVSKEDIHRLDLASGGGGLSGRIGLEPAV